MAHHNFLRITALLTLILLPIALFSQPDETMPESIPYEILDDWKDQGGTAEEIEASLSKEYAEKCDGTFESACHWRRVAKLKPFMGNMKKVLYAKHFNFGGGIVRGHHAPYQGEVILIDPTISRNRWPENDNRSIKMLAPERDAPIDPSDAIADHDDALEFTFQNPWPFDEKNFLVSWSESAKKFNVYFMSANASRELIAWDNSMSVSQPIVMDPPCPFNKLPPLIPQVSDYTQQTAVLGVANVYQGMGSKG